MRGIRITAIKFAKMRAHIVVGGAVFVFFNSNIWKKQNVKKTNSLN